MQVVYIVIEITATIDVGLLCPYENVETYMKLLTQKHKITKQKPYDAP